MNDAVKSIVEAASRLTYRERSEIVEALADTLAPEVEATDPLTLDPVWLAEIRRRSREFDEGKVKPIPWEEVKRKLDEKYGDVNA